MLATTIGIGTLMVGSAGADNMELDGDTVTASFNNAVNQDGCLAASKTYNGKARLSYTAGNSHWVPGAAISLTLTADAAAVAAGITTSSNQSLNLPSTWTTGSVQDVDVTFTVPANTYDGTYKVSVAASGAGTDNKGPINLIEADFWNFNVSGCPRPAPPATPTNARPTVSTAAPDAGGNEGASLSTAGAFSDADGNALTITQISGAGTVTQGTSGAWSWSHAPTDNGSGTVEVQASDGTLTVTDTFDWTAANVAPVITAVTATAVGQCGVSVSASFGDAGTADTHTASINWDSLATGGTASAGTVAGQSVSGTHTYTAAGTYLAAVTVTDDDGGESSRAAAAQVTTRNRASAIMEPVKPAGASNFKIGSTIPVKIQVFDCGDVSVQTLAPAVSLVRVDGLVDGVEVVSGTTDVTTNGKNMRWSDDKYIYNLSTKNSQFSPTGGALSTGTYRVTVSDASFSEVTEKFDLKK